MHSFLPIAQSTELSMRHADNGTLVIGEAEDDLFSSKTVETASLCVSLLTIFIAAAFGAASILFANNPGVPNLLVASASLGAAGLILYAFGTRGFRR